MPSLLDEAGYFYDFEHMPEFMAQVRLDQLEMEFRAQIETVLAAGLEPTHLDWHSLRIENRADIFDVMFRLAREYGLALRVASQSSIEKLQSLGLPTHDHDFWTATSLTRPIKLTAMPNCCASLPAGLSEWAVHPGLDSAELLAIEPGGTRIRQADFDFLTSQQAKDVDQRRGDHSFRLSSLTGSLEKEHEFTGKHIMKIQSLTGAWQFRRAGTEEWLLASVPGGVHTDLLALDRIPDPFAGDNEKRVQWVAEADWEYRYQFDAAPKLLSQPHIWLVCDGLDTLATVSLNGSELGRAENMFRQYRWDVKPLLKSGGNDLHIAFDSPVRFTAAQQAIRPMAGVSQAIPGGPHLRKAPCQFGWDWGPQLPPIGIWKDIRLEGYEGARITDVHLSQTHNDGQVTVEAQVTVESWDEAPRSATLRIVAPDGQVFETSTEKSAPITEAGFRSRLPIRNCGGRMAMACDSRTAKPGRVGSRQAQQPLYQVSVELHQDDILLEKREYQLGLRTLELRQEPDEWGRSFIFVVNGVPIFAKGSNWIPADSFPTRISDAYLEGLIRAAADTHQNMLRVWGGGFFEEERFYDLCDRYGILIWQDFIFSCSIYPLDDPDFLENVRVEVVENIRRLRHRASLALWCGNNEMEWGWESWGWAKHPHGRSASGFG